ncbi:unnamed protein product [Darwinula stevensoni]|uniref:Uncharacterized protein n=1 Tax=Darwinula stevensoni TaxID=69355 RepID=A0A7R8XHT6_9CRUS|nr:unnamed protein product [Darwinula stevensoni]CAG0890678.1 unnamed protein product [Darwinula stevensoni]
MKDLPFVLSLSVKEERLKGKKIILLEKGVRKEVLLQKDAPYSNRVVALNPSTKKFLEDIGVWDIIASVRFQAVKRLQVWETHSDAMITFNHDALTEDVAYIVENDLITEALCRVAENEPNLDLRFQTQIKNYDVPSVKTKTNDLRWARVTLSDDSMISSKLLGMIFEILVDIKLKSDEFVKRSSLEEELEELRLKHEEVATGFEYLQAFTSKQLTVSTACDIIGIIAACYFSFSAFLSGGGYYSGLSASALASLSVGFVHTLKFVWIAERSHELVETASLGKRHLRRVRQSKLSPSEKHEVSTFLKQLDLAPVRPTAAGFFDLNRSLLVSFQGSSFSMCIIINGSLKMRNYLMQAVGAVLTYLIVLIQYKDMIRLFSETPSERQESLHDNTRTHWLPSDIRFPSWISSASVYLPILGSINRGHKLSFDENLEENAEKRLVLDLPVLQERDIGSYQDLCSGDLSSSPGSSTLHAIPPCAPMKGHYMHDDLDVVPFVKGVWLYTHEGLLQLPVPAPESSEVLGFSLDLPNSNEEQEALKDICSLRSQLDEANTEKEAAKGQIQVLQQQLQDLQGLEAELAKAKGEIFFLETMLWQAEVHREQAEDQLKEETRRRSHEVGRVRLICSQ